MIDSRGQLKIWPIATPYVIYILTCHVQSTNCLGLLIGATRERPAVVVSASDEPYSQNGELTSMAQAPIPFNNEIL